MTKPRRVALLVADLLMLLGGIGALIIFVALTITLHQIAGWPHIPSDDEIRAIAEVSKLRGMAADAYEKVGVFAEMVDAYRWYFLVFGSLLFVGSILHFALTPWKLKERTQ